MSIEAGDCNVPRVARLLYHVRFIRGVTTMAKTHPYHQWLKELTSLPTASGREDRVVAWVQSWARKRRNVEVQVDRTGNLVLARRGIKPGSQPIYFEAHMDHPSFVVERVLDDREVVAGFRGGVKLEFFEGSPVVLHPLRGKPHTGRVVSLLNHETGTEVSAGIKRCRVRFDRSTPASVGDVLMWDVGPARIEKGLLHTPACDDVAGVAAALAAFDALGPKSPVRVLLTRAEEMGFVGAIAAVKNRTIPRRARLVCLENSKSYAESPIGGGPIVRVGDLTSTFDPDLTYQAGRIAQTLAQKDAGFKWQRKLMPGGTCEASAFQSFGHTATCLCLPLGNYHNMNEATGRIAAEVISVADFDGLVRLLVAVGQSLDLPDQAPPLRSRLDKLFADRRWLVRS
jgi:endoglucanase